MKKVRKSQPQGMNHATSGTSLRRDFRNSSPRAALAFSTLEAVERLGKKFASVRRWIAGRANPKDADTKPALAKQTVCLGAMILALATLSSRSTAQSGMASAMPHVVTYSGRLSGAKGQPLAQAAGVTFSIYSEQEGGTPLWIETQSVKSDAAGHYSAQLGSTKASGLPLSLFASGEARWLGIRVNGGAERPRVMLLSVPYALKAADAETVGGLPPSAFVLASPAGSPSAPIDTAASTLQNRAMPALTGTGTTNYLPLWMDNSGTLGNSAIFQTGTSPTAKIGINMSTPVNALEVQGTAMVHGQLTMPSSGLATASAGKKSYPLNIRAASYNSSSKASVFQNFLWEAEPAANNTANPIGTLNLLFASGSASPAETGLRIASNGQINFASGQTFPGVIAEVDAGSGLTEVDGGSAVKLAVDPTQVPYLLAPNVFSNDQTINGKLTATGVVTGSAFQIGSDFFAFGNRSNLNAFLGFSGNSTLTGRGDTAVGVNALLSATTGAGNTAMGVDSLVSDTTGSDNTAIGDGSLLSNTTGGANTAVGGETLLDNSSGNSNTAIGSLAENHNTTGNFNTALGGSTLLTNAAGSFNTASGYGAIQTNTASNNTATGYYAMQGSTTGTFNAAFGSMAMHDNLDTNYITAVGYDAGVGVLHGALNTYLGANAYALVDKISNSGAIGANAHVAQSNALILGGTTNNSVTVGIGTTAPYNDYALDVETIRGNGIINGGVVVNASGGNLYLGMTNTVHKFRVDTNGGVYGAGFFSSGADFAESVAVEGTGSKYEPGDVLEIDQKANRHLALSHRPYATLVAGIYSTKPGVLASPHPVDEPPSATAEVPLAIVGIVPCKVTTENGAIARGDLLVTSSRAGYAMKGTDRKRMLGAVVGKALEPLAKSSGVIEVLVTLQ